jgi:hypothetical protein
LGLATEGPRPKIDAEVAGPAFLDRAGDALCFFMVSLLSITNYFNPLRPGKWTQLIIPRFPGWVTV